MRCPRRRPRHSGRWRSIPISRTPMSHSAYASFTYDWDWPAATKHFDRALALNRLTVENHTYYPFYLTVGGRSAEAIDVARRALERNPVSASMSHNLAVQLALSRQFDAAIEECRRTLDLDPSFGLAYDVMAASLASKGMFREALPLRQKAAALSPGNMMSRALLGAVLANLGQRQEALQILEQLAAASKQRYIPAQSFAIVYTGLGDKDQAFAWLDKAYEERVESSRISQGRTDVGPDSDPTPVSTRSCAASDYRDRRRRNASPLRVHPGWNLRRHAGEPRRNAECAGRPTPPPRSRPPRPGRRAGASRRSRHQSISRRPRRRRTQSADVWSRVGHGQGRDPSERRQARLHEPGSVLVARPAARRTDVPTFVVTATEIRKSTASPITTTSVV